MIHDDTGDNGNEHQGSDEKDTHCSSTQNTNTENESNEVKEASINCEDYNFNVFIFDTETTGRSGIYMAHPDHIMIQICIISVASGNVFYKMISVGENFFINEASVACHGLNVDYLNKFGSPLVVVIEELFEWIKEEISASKKEDVLWIAHNCDFDFIILLKSVCVAIQKAKEDSILKEYIVGRNGENLNWYFYDTLKQFKLYYPDIKYNADKAQYALPPFHKSPYKLQSLMKHFLDGYIKNSDEKFHDAKFDCVCLIKLFTECILSKEHEAMISVDWKYKLTGLLHRKGMKSKKLMLVEDIKFFKLHWAAQICQICNYEFKKSGGEYLKYCTNSRLITAAHVMQFGWMKVLHMLDVYTENPKSLKFGKLKSNDAWWLLCREIESMLRLNLRIYSDESILEMLQYVTSSNSVDLIYYMKRDINKENIGDPFFPTMPGEPVSFLPFEFSHDATLILYSEFGHKTGHDMYISYLNTPARERNEWRFARMASLSPEYRDEFSLDKMNANFDSISPKYNS